MGIRNEKIHIWNCFMTWESPLCQCYALYLGTSAAGQDMASYKPGGHAALQATIQGLESPECKIYKLIHVVACIRHQE